MQAVFTSGMICILVYTNKRSLKNLENWEEKHLSIPVAGG